jgi:hypothetical protein
VIVAADASAGIASTAAIAIRGTIVSFRIQASS